MSISWKRYLSPGLQMVSTVTLGNGSQASRQEIQSKPFLGDFLIFTRLDLCIWGSKLCITINVPSKLCAYTQVMRRAHTKKLGAHKNV